MSSNPLLADTPLQDVRKEEGGAGAQTKGTYLEGIFELDNAWVFSFY